MLIKYSLKNVYGNDWLYPESPDAVLITKLTRRKTLLRQDIELLREHGAIVEQVLTQTGRD